MVGDIPSSTMGQILEAFSLGIVVVDPDLRVRMWNRWMELHSGRPAKDVLDRPLQDVFPDMKVSRLQRKIKSVLLIGNYAFLDARVHGHLFPLPADDQLAKRFDFMQQSCTLMPLRDEAGKFSLVCITVADDTHVVCADLDLKVANTQLQDLNRTDALTRVSSRAYALERLATEISRVQRHPGPLSVALSDIDHFKSINDTHGHLGGDEVLRRVGAALKGAVRETDVVGRYGGEEFVVIMPDTPEDGALLAADRIRKAIEALEITWEGKRVPVTMSWGVAEWGPDPSAEAFLDRADGALYVAKRSGRNRCVRAKPAGAPPDASDPAPEHAPTL